MLNSSTEATMSALRVAFKEQGNEIAAIIVETVAGNMGVVLGKQEFLQLLRDITKEYGSDYTIRASYNALKKVHNI